MKGIRNTDDRTELKTMRAINGNSAIKTALMILLAVAFLVLAGTHTAEAAKPCKSDAYKKIHAEEYCQPRLKCEDKSPPQVMKCTGRTRRWICRCKKKKAGTSFLPGIEIGIGIGTGGRRHRDDRRRRDYRRE